MNDISASYVRLVLLLAATICALPGLASATDDKDSTPALKPDAALRPVIEAGLRVRYVLRDVLDTNRVQIDVQIDKPPTNLAFDLSLRAGNEIWPVGPVAWATTNIASWSFDLDLPPGVETVDAIFTPDALAMHKAFRSELYPPRNRSDIKEIWDGPPIVFTNISVESQPCGMCTIKPPMPAIAREEAIDVMDPGDPITARLRRDGDMTFARRACELQVQAFPKDARSLYDFGCLVEADGDWAYAMQLFLKARHATSQATLSRLAQRQLRRICSIYLYKIREKNDAPAMYHLGEAYENGWGVTQISSEAKHWYLNAANAGIPEAMYRLAAMYEQEIGATEHTKESHAWYSDRAYTWYRKAADLDNAEAKKWLATHAQAAQTRIPPGQKRDEGAPLPIASNQSDLTNFIPLLYQDWVAKYGRTNLNGFAYQSPDFTNSWETTFKLVVTIVDRDAPPRTNADGSFFTHDLEEQGIEVASNGYVNYFSYSFSDFLGDTRGGSGPCIPASDMDQLNKLLEDLPPDHSRLPPANRCMMFQTMDHGRLISRVYDRANAPETVWKILSLCQSRIGMWIPTFNHRSAIAAARYDGDFLCLTPDQKQIVYDVHDGDLQLWNPATHELVSETPHRYLWNSLVFSPDGNVAVGFFYGDLTVLDARTWKTLKSIHAPKSGENLLWSGLSQFTPDGRYFVAQSINQPLRIYDAQTWQPVDETSEIPTNAAQYLLSPAGKHALVRTSAGSLLLWDPNRQRAMAQLTPEAYVQKIAFSPDESLVAVVTVSREPVQRDTWTNPRIRIWHITNGKLITELNPHATYATQWVKDLLWTPDSRNLLVAGEGGPYSSYPISLYEVKNGRHWADLEGSYEEIVGMALLPDSGKLVAGFSDGNICFWDFNGILKQVQQFKDSLGHQYKVASLGQ